MQPTVKHQILNHENHDPRNSRHHLIRDIFRSRQEKNAPFTCNLICKITLKSVHQIRGNTLISKNSDNAGIKVCHEYDVLQYSYAVTTYVSSDVVQNQSLHSNTFFSSKIHHGFEEWQWLWHTIHHSSNSSYSIFLYPPSLPKKI